MGVFTNSFYEQFWVPVVCLALFGALWLQQLARSSPWSHEVSGKMGETECKQICNVSNAMNAVMESEARWKK